MVYLIVIGLLGDYGTVTVLVRGIESGELKRSPIPQFRKYNKIDAIIDIPCILR